MRPVNHARSLVELVLVLLDELLDGLLVSLLLRAGERNLFDDVAGGTQRESGARHLICVRLFARLANLQSSSVFSITKHGLTVLGHASRCAFELLLY